MSKIPQRGNTEACYPFRSSMGGSLLGGAAAVDSERAITLGNTALELIYVGKNHSDGTLVMRLPKEKIIFTVDWIPLETVPFRGMADTYLPDIEDGRKKVLPWNGRG